MTAAVDVGALEARIEGVGFWAPGLPDWEAARAFVHDGALREGVVARPSPQLLPPNERRRAPETVAVALEVAQAACLAAGRDPATLPSVFASTHGDLAITDYMCATLASAPATVSPIRFHNSVHNAAAGYWTIGVGALAPATAISAFDATFAQGLVEAMAQLAAGVQAVLLVAYDTQSTGPLGRVSRSDGLLGGALVLSRDGRGPRMRATFMDGRVEPVAGDGPLARRAAANAMAPMLPLFDALAAGRGQARLHAGPDRALLLDLNLEIEA